MRHSALELDFRAVDEPEAGPKWRELFEEFWPAYERWFLAEGDAARPRYAEAVRALHGSMPELMPVYERLVELAGGGDRVARCLSLYRPAPFLLGCSQAVWLGDEPALVRNYDYAPRLCDGVILRSAWTGPTVVASVDCLWGVLDGMNEHGLTVALAFGGRPTVGDGFAVTLILRYVLETCASVADAAEILERVRSHMTYTVAAVDADGAHVTAFVAPDRPTILDDRLVSTNHQRRVQWPAHANATRSVQRERRLAELLAEPAQTLDTLADQFLHPPLLSRDYGKGHGTLYTVVYRPRRRSLTLLWPDHRWELGIDAFDEGVHVARYAQEAPSGAVER